MLTVSFTEKRALEGVGGRTLNLKEIGINMRNWVVRLMIGIIGDLLSMQD
jgi:hypothetical protein